jgi:hypothetical protein
MDEKLLRKILKKAEIKRVCEKLTKKELCNIYGFNYNFYMNCLSGRNFPSKKMTDSLLEYLETPTSQVYKRVFASREIEQKFHEKLEIDESELSKMIETLKSKDMGNVSDEEIEMLKSYVS